MSVKVAADIYICVSHLEIPQTKKQLSKLLFSFLFYIIHPPNHRSYIFFHLRKKLVEIRNGFYAFVKVSEFIFFVGAVQVVAV